MHINLEMFLFIFPKYIRKKKSIPTLKYIFIMLNMLYDGSFTLSSHSSFIEWCLAWREFLFDMRGVHTPVKIFLHQIWIHRFLSTWLNKYLLDMIHCTILNLANFCFLLLLLIVCRVSVQPNVRSSWGWLMLCKQA